MATRFYLPSTGAAAVSPAYDAAWEETALADRLACVTAKSSTAMATITIQEPPDDEDDALCRQWVSGPMAGSGTLSGTIKGQMRVAESDAAINARAQMVVRIVSLDGATVRGTVLAANTGSLASEFATTLTNRKFPLAWAGAGTALSSVAWQAGDRIVIEIGVHSHTNPLAGDSYTFRIGDTGGTDLPENETETADNVPWVEFSQTFTIATASDSVAFTGSGTLEVDARSGEDVAVQVAINF